MTGYSALLLDHFDRPRHVAPLPPGPGHTIRGSAGRQAEGGAVSFEARIRAGRIDAVAFRAFGCPELIAACSLATERLSGRPVEALADLRATELAGELAAPPAKLGRLLLLEDALRDCWQAWENTRLCAPSAGA